MAVDVNAPAPGNTVAYKAEAGDTFETIATRFYGIALAAVPLARMNGKDMGDALAVDDVVNLPQRMFGFDAFLPAWVNMAVFWLVGVDVTEAPTHFAPGKELWENGDPNDIGLGEKCRIKYVVLDPLNRITEATLEVARAGEPNAVLARFELTADQFAAGEHEYEWDGLCTEGDRADQFVHALYSPYIVRVVATSPVGQTSGQRSVAVNLKEIRIERAPYLTDGSTPGEGSVADYQAKLVN